MFVSSPHPRRLALYLGAAAIGLAVAVAAPRLADAAAPAELAIPGTAWHGAYFNNIDLAGNPEVVREDSDIDFDWGGGSPSTKLDGDNFSVRWERYVDTPGGRYRIDVTVDDGIRVFLDGALVVDAWHDQAATRFSREVDVSPGRHLLRVEYYERSGNALVHVNASPLAAPPTGWRGEYFGNAALSGAPLVVRDDSAVDFDWGLGSPAPGTVPAEYFSARWTKVVGFAPGRYRFTTVSDDGVRVWVNNRLLIDRWASMSATSVSDVVDVAGPSEVRIEYFEGIGAASVRLTWAPEGTGAVQSAAGEVVVDEATGNTLRGGDPTAWQRAAAGFGGSTWTLNNDIASSDYNWLRWLPALAPGRYEVFAFIPSRNANTRAAQYWVAHADGFGGRIVNQAAYSDVWVSLGTYRFSGSGKEYASLNDVTGEPRLSRRIGFDAVKWVPR